LPNAKIYVDQTAWVLREDIVDLLPQLRDLFCHRLSVGPSACQIAVLPVDGLSDQPHINVELRILPAADRTREALIELAVAIQDLFAGTRTGKTAVRIETLDPETYVAVKG
jgi:hypothetical protein